MGPTLPGNLIPQAAKLPHSARDPTIRQKKVLHCSLCHTVFNGIIHCDERLTAALHYLNGIEINSGALAKIFLG
jgi:hypothetical protein